MYTKGSVFKAICTHRRKTIEAPKDQPILSPSEESSSPQASSSSTSREVSQNPLVTATNSDQVQESHPLLFSTHLEDQTTLVANQPLRTISVMRKSKEEEKGSSS